MYGLNYHQNHKEIMLVGVQLKKNIHQMLLSNIIIIIIDYKIFIIHHHLKILKLYLYNFSFIIYKKQNKDYQLYCL